jgi:RNA polymerase sigma-70 factor (ECF subfamily)
MAPERSQQRLSQISTVWPLVAQAAGGDAAKGGPAYAALVERYQSAVYSYLLAAVRDPDVADELFQEFALKLVRGGFGRADPKRGRFRNYVKSALINLVINHQKKQRRLPGPVSPSTDAPALEPEGFDSDQAFLAGWRAALLDRAWEGLAAAQDPEGPPFYTVLRFRTEHAGLTSAELAGHLTAQLSPDEPFTEAGLRKLLQRARERFADILVEEVARSLQCPSADVLEQELIDLGFHAYCRRALTRRRGVSVTESNSGPSPGN